MSFKALTNLIFNEGTGSYSVVELGFKYEFPEALYDDFRQYILRYNFASRWHKQLNDANIRKVSKTSAY